MPAIKIKHDEFLKYYNQGLNATDIAAALGVVRSAVQKHMKKYNLKPHYYKGCTDRWRDEIESGVPMEERKLCESELLSYLIGYYAGETIEELAEEHRRKVDFVLAGLERAKKMFPEVVQKYELKKRTKK